MLDKNGYRYEFISHDEFKPIFKEHVSVLFPDRIDLDDVHSAEEIARRAELAAHKTTGLVICVVVYDGDMLIGWSMGDQESGERFHMRNSAVYPQYRRKGVYTTMMKMVIDEAVKSGFQLISSRHHASNNAVIIPKLKAGFMIGGMEISDRYGTMVQLYYYPHPKRNEIYRYRTGEIKSL